MLFLLLIAVIAVAIIGVAVRPSINTSQLQMDLLRNRILYDPNGILFVDSNGALPGVINREYLSQARIDERFRYPEHYGGAKLTLLNEDNTPLATAIINEPTYTRISTNAAASLSGGGTLRTFVYAVVIVDGTDRLNGYLVIVLAGPALA